MIKIETPTLNEIEDKLVQCFGNIEYFSQKMLPIVYDNSHKTSPEEYEEFISKFEIAFKEAFTYYGDEYERVTRFEEIATQLKLINLENDPAVESTLISKSRQEIEEYTSNISIKIERHISLSKQVIKYSDRITKKFDYNYITGKYDKLFSQKKTADDPQLYEYHDQLVSRAKSILFLGKFILISHGLNQQATKWLSVLDEYGMRENILDNENKFEWLEPKSDLAELIWALYKSERIKDKSTGKPITQKDLVNYIEKTFAINLDVPGLLKGRDKAFKTTKDNKTFMATLLELYKTRIESSDR